MTPFTRSRAYAAALTGCLAALIAAPLGLAASSTAAAPAIAASTTTPTTTPASVTTGDIGVSAVPAEQGVVRAGADLPITVVVTNTTGSALPTGTATVFLGASSADRTELATWLSIVEDAQADDALLPRSVLQVPTPVLAPGQSAVLDGVVIPAAALGLVEPVALGARELSVVVTAGSDATGSIRTAITVAPNAPDAGTPVASLALATPLDVPATGEGLIPSDLLASFTSPTGVLTRQLDQAIGRGVAIGIDPRVIASVRALGGGAPDSAVQWLQRLSTAPNETFALAYADSDIAATSQAGAGVLAPTSISLDAAVFPPAADPSASPTGGAGTDDAQQGDDGEGGQEQGPDPSAGPGDGTGDGTGTGVDTLPTLEELLLWDYSSTGIAWPVDDTVVTSDLDTFADAGLDTTILSSTNVGLGAVSAGPTAMVGERSVAVSDDAISSTFRDAVTAPTVSEWQSAVTELTASLAALAAQGGDAASALATLDRTVPVGTYRLADTLAAIEVLPWVNTVGLGQTLAAPGKATTLLDSTVAADRMTQITSLLEAEAATNQFATVLDSPELITGERRLSLMAVTSLAWIAESEAWAPAVDAYRSRSSEILTSVQIVQSSDLLLPSQNGDLPISVSNTLPYAVTVYVTVRPQTPILNVLDSNVAVTVEANSQRRAPVPVQSVANGDVTIAVSLTSASGVAVSQPVFTTISVQAQWETAAVSVLAVLVIGVFAFGIVRTVRRRLKARRARENGEPVENASVQDEPVGPEPLGPSAAGPDAAVPPPSGDRG